MVVFFGKCCKRQQIKWFGKNSGLNYRDHWLRLQKCFGTKPRRVWKRPYFFLSGASCAAHFQQVVWEEDASMWTHVSGVSSGWNWKAWRTENGRHWGTSRFNIWLFHVPGVTCRKFDTDNVWYRRERSGDAYFATVYVHGFKWPGIELHGGITC